MNDHLHVPEIIRRWLTWEQVHVACTHLADRIMHASRVTPLRHILAVTRGGLLPAGILAHPLSIPSIDTIGVVSRLPNGQAIGPRIVKRPEVNGPVAQGGIGCLVVDDLVDSGSTFAAIRDLLPHAEYAACFAKPGSPTGGVHIGQRFPDDAWLVFPWERLP